MGYNPAIWVYLHSFRLCKITRNSEKMQAYSSSRSSKVIDLHVNQKCIYNFQLVLNSNYGHISYRFRDINAKSYKMAHFFSPYPCLTPCLGDLLEFLHETYPRKNRGMGILYWDNTNFNHFWLIQPSIFDLSIYAVTCKKCTRVIACFFLTARKEEGVEVGGGVEPVKRPHQVVRSWLVIGIWWSVVPMADQTSDTVTVRSATHYDRSTNPQYHCWCYD